MDAELERVLSHRLRAHIAALHMAVALGSPAILRAQVTATRARLDELRAIIEELGDQP